MLSTRNVDKLLDHLPPTPRLDSIGYDTAMIAFEPKQFWEPKQFCIPRRTISNESVRSHIT